MFTLYGLLQTGCDAQGSVCQGYGLQCPVVKGSKTFTREVKWEATRPEAVCQRSDF